MRLSSYQQHVAFRNKDGLACLADREAKGYEYPLISINGEFETGQLIQLGLVAAEMVEGKRHLHLTDAGRAALAACK